MIRLIATTLTALAGCLLLTAPALAGDVSCVPGALPTSLRASISADYDRTGRLGDIARALAVPAFEEAITACGLANSEAVTRAAVNLVIERELIRVLERDGVSAATLEAAWQATPLDQRLAARGSSVLDAARAVQDTRALTETVKARLATLGVTEPPKLLQMFIIARLRRESWESQF